MPCKQTILLITGVIVLVIAAAGASAYVTRDAMTPDKPKTEKTATVKTHKTEQISWNDPKPVPAPQPAKKCDDGNIVGAVVGGAAGGLVGNQFGKGKGKDLATIGGVIAGGTAGHQMIPTRGVLCR